MFNGNVFQMLGVFKKKRVRDGSDPKTRFGM